MTAHQAVHPIVTMCRVLGVSPSGYYAWRERPLSKRERADVKLSAEIHAIHRESRGTYGVPRIHAELAERGIHVGRKRVARLMRGAGLQGVSRRKTFRTTVRDETARPAPDLVERQFTAVGPDQLWVADITYEEYLRVRVLGLSVDAVAAADLDDLAQVHHGHAIRHVEHDLEVVRNEQVRELEPPAQVTH